MKRFATLLLMLAWSSMAFAQSSLVNGNFEGWFWAPHPTHPQQGFYEPQGPFFRTLNILDTIPTPPGLTVFRTDSVHGGNYAARLETKQIDVMQVLIPGVVGTLTINWAGMKAILGEPFTWNTRPTRFQGYYMAFPKNGDSTAAIILLSKWNAGTLKRDTIAYTRKVFYGTVPTYTLFDEPINYRDNTTMPDSITLLLLSCAGYNATFMMGSVGQVGSKAYFDDVTLTDIAGYEYLLMPEIKVQLAPVPVTDQLTVTLSSALADGMIEVYTQQGQTRLQQPLTALTNRLNVSGLTPGVYYYKVADGRKVIHSGSFIVTR